MKRLLRLAAAMLRRLHDEYRLRKDPNGFYRSQGVQIGVDVEILGGSIHTFGSEPYLISIGDGVTISEGVRFVTHDGGLRTIRDSNPGAYHYNKISVGENAFIGMESLLLPGATVGKGSVIGARSVVSGTIDSGVVAAGVPARLIRPVEEYGYARRDSWIDTSGLSASEKRTLIEAKLLSEPGAER